MKAKIFHYNIVQSLNNVKDKEKNEIPIDNKVIFRFADSSSDIEISMNEGRNMIEIRTLNGIIKMRPSASNAIYVESVSDWILKKR